MKYYRGIKDKKELILEISFVKYLGLAVALGLKCDCNHFQYSSHGYSCTFGTKLLKFMLSLAVELCALVI